MHKLSLSCAQGGIKADIEFQGEFDMTTMGKGLGARAERERSKVQESNPPSLKLWRDKCPKSVNVQLPTSGDQRGNEFAQVVGFLGSSTHARLQEVMGKWVGE